MNPLKCVVDAYNKYFEDPAKTILEIGSRDGHDAYYLYLKLKAHKAYTFEANPSCYKVINLNYPEFHNIYGAVSNFTGQSTFNMVESSDWDAVGTSSLKDRNDSWYDGRAIKITVDVDTMHKYIINYNIKPPFDVVKVDVEGCSYEVLEGFGKFIKDIKVLHVENETMQYWNDQKLADEVGQMLISKGFFLEHQERFGENSVDEVWVNGDLIQ
jgi:FkbM family methyltransferase